MSNPKVERAIALAAQIEASRANTARLEAEFEELVSGRGPRIHLNGHTPKRKIRRVVRRGVSNRDRVFQAFKRAGEPVKLFGLRKKLGISESALFSHVSRLVKEKKLEKVGHGLYKMKS